MSATLKIKVHPSFIVYIAVISVFASPQTSVSALVALIVHESCHFIASKWLGERIATIDITPFGGVMTYAPGKSPHKGVRGCIIAAAGPLGNYGMILLLSQPFMMRWMSYEILRQAIVINLGMMLLNLLPALPLDGGRIAFCAGYYLFSISSITKVLSLSGIGVGCALIGFGLYGAYTLGCVNISLLMIGGYLVVYAQKSRLTLLSENIYALLQEKQQRNKAPKRICLISVLPETTLRNAVYAAGRASKVLFYIHTEISDDWIEDTEIISGFLQKPDSEISSVMKRKSEKQPRTSNENTDNALQHPSL